VNYYPIVDTAITVYREAKAMLVVMPSFEGMHELNAYSLVGTSICLQVST
jgi:hypothetical protein